MKKIFKLFAISLVFVLPIVSCTTDDESAKQAQKDKESLEIPGDEGTSNIQHNQLALYASGTNINIGTLVNFTTMLNGVDVTNEVTYYVNGIQVGGSSITSAYGGTFKIQAKKEGYIDSPVVTVIYGGTNPVPTGNFIFNNQGYNVTSNILVLNGAFNNGPGTIPFSSWTSITYNNTTLANSSVLAIIDFKTPFTITNPETNEGNIILPNGTNEVYAGAQRIKVLQTELVNIAGTGTIHYQNLNLESQVSTFTSTISYEGNSLQINYFGAFSFIDTTQEERPAARQTNKLYKVSSKKPAKFNINK